VPPHPQRLREVFSSISKRQRSRRSQSAGDRDAARATAQTPPAIPGSSFFTDTTQSSTALQDLWPVVAICVTACVSLYLVQFVGSYQVFGHFFPDVPRVYDSYRVLRIRAWWVGWTVVSYFALPAILMTFLPGKRLRDCNLSLRGFRQHFWIYAGLYAAMVPIIWVVSLTPTFLEYYPMYAQAGRSWPDLLMWEGMYAGQFIALEFFFRGFLVGGLSRHIGILSIPVSVVPYMMIHFNKPWPEAAASVAAGFILGTLAWKTKSIWGGVCVHCAVASTMDLLALAHKSQLPWLHT
jgi:membrane protease YdiL (CAAX protease family)